MSDETIILYVEWVKMFDTREEIGNIMPLIQYLCLWFHDKYSEFEIPLHWVQNHQDLPSGLS